MNVGFLFTWFDLFWVAAIVGLSWVSYKRGYKKAEKDQQDFDAFIDHIVDRIDRQRKEMKDV